jgi:hypothetical protein
LQKSYIKENDYWLNFFEDFRIPENPGRQELEALFVDLMKANFGFFRDNIEMQKIILWQISESNPLMRSVSDSREREGGKLLEMTDAFFRDSGTNFRALVALILGGTYYLVLHAETNKSTVCGIDINLEKDREAILTCIEQLLRLAWQQPHGAETLKDGEGDELKVLEELAGSQPPPVLLFKNEAIRVKKVILERAADINDETLLSGYLQEKISRLAALGDGLRPAGAYTNAAALLILDLIRAVSTPFAARVPGETALPLVFRRSEGDLLFCRWQGIEETLAGQATDPELIKLLALPFLYFRGAETVLRWAEYRYLLNYTDAIEKQARGGAASAADWMLLLISLGYNHSRFTVWCFGQLQERIKNKNRDEAILVLGNARLEISSCSREPSLRFEPRKPHIADEINQWIGEELAAITGLPYAKGTDLSKWETIQQA